MLPASFMTARDTARTTERGGDGFESDMMNTAREMHTARGFETDDYQSAAENSYYYRGGMGSHVEVMYILTPTICIYLLISLFVVHHHCFVI